MKTSTKLTVVSLSGFLIIIVMGILSNSNSLPHNNTILGILGLFVILLLVLVPVSGIAAWHYWLKEYKEEIKEEVVREITAKKKKVKRTN